MYGAEKGYLFAVKCLMKEVPTKVITMTLVATLFILAYALRVCERYSLYISNSLLIFH